MEYRAPADASKTALPSGSVDIVFSNNVLEHVEPDSLGPLLAEARRILRLGGVAIHSVDLSDHYSHGDPSLPRIHFLKYPDWQFRWINNRWIYQNRLRPCQYRQIIESAGLRVLKWEVHTDEESVRHLRKMRVARCFQGFPEDELAADALVLAAGPAGRSGVEAAPQSVAVCGRTVHELRAIALEG
ncbi:MAG: methyltransferase domain-containing protein [Armatimonadota bacterium]